MKHLLKFFIPIALSVCCAWMTACSDDEPLQDDYYVRYSMGNDPEGEVFMSYHGPDGDHIIQGKHSQGTVEVTVGPVEKGFKASVSASVDGHAPEWLRIEVCEGAEPFVQKEYLLHGTYIYCTVGEDR